MAVKLNLTSLKEVTQVCQKLAERVKELETRVEELKELLASRPVISQTFIYDLGDSGFRVKEPVPVIIEEYAAEFVAKVPELDCYGSAETEGEAIAALKAELVSLYEDIVSTPPEQLGKLPQGWLRVLRRLVENVAGA